MQAFKVAEGRAIDHTPSSAVAAGQVVVIGESLYVAEVPIPAGTTGALATEGVFDFVKKNDAFTSGDIAYWNATGDPVGGVAGSGAAQASSSGSVPIGIVVRDAADTDARVRVMLRTIRMAP